MGGKVAHAVLADIPNLDLVRTPNNYQIHTGALTLFRYKKFY